MLFPLDIDPDAFFLVIATPVVAGTAAAGALLYIFYIPIQIYLVKSGKMTKEQKNKIDRIFLRAIILLTVLAFLILAHVYYTG